MTKKTEKGGKKGNTSGGDERRKHKGVIAGAVLQMSQERKSVRRRCSFLLRKSFQYGVHLFCNGRQRKLKLILQGDKKENK